MGLLWDCYGIAIWLLCGYYVVLCGCYAVMWLLCGYYAATTRYHLRGALQRQVSGVVAMWLLRGYDVVAVWLLGATNEELDDVTLW